MMLRWDSETFFPAITGGGGGAGRQNMIYRNFAAKIAFRQGDRKLFMGKIRKAQ